MPKPSENLAMNLKESSFRKYRWISLALIVGLTVLLGANMSNTKFEFNFEKLFPTDDPETAYFNEFRENFRPENDQLPIIIQRNEGVFNVDFFKKIDQLTKQLEKIDDVEYVFSLTNQNELFFTSWGVLIKKPYVDFSDFDSKRDSTRIFKNEELLESMISKDAKAVCVFVKYTDYLSVEKSFELVDNVQKVLDKHEFDDVRMFGKAYAQKYILKTMSTEMRFFLSLSAILVALFLFIMFRSIWGVLIPQVILFLTLIWLIGTLGLFGQKINILLTVMPSIMFVVSMSDVIHLVSCYLDISKKEKDNFKAIRLAIKNVAFATMLTSLTTAIGFFSLYIVPIQPIQSFGVIMGVGVLIAFLLTFGLLPILFYWFPGRVRKSKKKQGDFWKDKLSTWFVFVLLKRKAVLTIVTVIFLVSAFGASKLNSNNYLMDDLTPDDPFAQDIKYIGNNFGGTRTFAMTITLKDKEQDFWNVEALQEIDTIQTYLENEYGVQVRTSLIDALKVLNRGKHLGDSSYYQLPISQRHLRPLKKILKLAGKGKAIRNFIDSSELSMQIVGYIKDEGRDRVTKRNKKLFKFIAAQDNKGFDVKITGTAHLLDKNLKFLVSNMFFGLGISILMVALIMGIVFKSIRIALLSLIPNLIPLVIIAGVMGYMGIELKMSTVIIFSIAFGIVVDDTIHFLGKFKMELKNGYSPMYALKRSYLTTGKAMILTTLVLCAGFVIMIFSSFMGTFYLGFLLSMVLFIALLADLTLLPVLLVMFFKSKKPTK
jgi:predicted RND superfamily exporter protein